MNTSTYLSNRVPTEALTPYDQWGIAFEIFASKAYACVPGVKRQELDATSAKFSQALACSQTGITRLGYMSAPTVAITNSRGFREKKSLAGQ